MWLANLFYDLEDIFYDIEYKFWYVGYWLEKNTGWTGLANLFYDIADFFDAAWRKCRDIGREIEDWWDTISQTASDLSSLWSYAYGWLTDKATSAYNTASTAISKANQAINDAANASQKAIDEALAALAAAKAYAETLIPDIAGWVTSHALDIYDAIKGYLTDIAAWVTSHGLDIYDAIKGYIEDVGTWFTEHTVDVWDALKGYAADAVAAYTAWMVAPVKLIEEWFDDIQDFFNAPWDWLEAKFTDWFLGKE